MLGTFIRSPGRYALPAIHRFQALPQLPNGRTHRSDIRLAVRDSSDPHGSRSYWRAQGPGTTRDGAVRTGCNHDQQPRRSPALDGRDTPPGAGDERCGARADLPGGFTGAGTPKASGTTPSWRTVPQPAEQPILFKASTGPGSGKACQTTPGPFSTHYFRCAPPRHLAEGYPQVLIIAPGRLRSYAHPNRQTGGLGWCWPPTPNSASPADWPRTCGVHGSNPPDQSGCPQHGFVAHFGTCAHKQGARP